MQNILIIDLLVLILIILASILSFNVRKLKQMGKNEELDKLVKKFPDNITMCKDILKKLGNDHTKVKENKESETNLYMVMNDTISIANIEGTYTRVQTIAHECLHSIQSKKMLWFNFVYSNICILAYVTIMVLTMCNIINNGIFFIAVLLALAIPYYVVRSYLEIDAMTKARYLADEYIKENKLTSKAKREKLMQEYEKLNNLGIKGTCYSLASKELIKIVIYAVICIILCKA